MRNVVGGHVSDNRSVVFNLYDFPEHFLIREVSRCKCNVHGLILDLLLSFSLNAH